MTTYVRRITASTKNYWTALETQPDNNSSVSDPKNEMELKKNAASSNSNGP